MMAIRWIARTSVPLAAVLAMGGCLATPGLPDVQIQIPDSPAEQACKDYANAFINGSTRESITAALQAARSGALASGDVEAGQVAGAIDEVLANTVMGTAESLYAAHDRVAALCREAGVTITIEP